MKKFILFFFAVSFLASCAPKRYITQDYHKLSRTHKKIAVLPYESKYTGRLPKELTEDDVIALQEEEALLFQRSLYQQLLEESRNMEKGDIYVSIQNIDDTNAILQDNSISIEQSWSQSPTKMAQLLGVDAVVKIDMHKDYWLSNGESAVLGVATRLAGLSLPGVNNTRLTRTSEIYINANPIDATEGVSIWAWNRKVDTNWQWETDEAISRINHQISKRFPYRKDL
jgi:hypothetical protein